MVVQKYIQTIYYCFIVSYTFICDIFYIDYINILILQLLSKAAREFSSSENTIAHTEENLKKMHLISVHMGYQYENILQSAQMLNEISEQVVAMQK